MSFPHIARAQAGNSETIKVGLIGCGGRGTGAATQAIKADPNTRLWAVADAFADKIEKPLATLGAAFGDRIDVPKERQFVGLDAYERLLASGIDVVLIAGPPGFRPQHVRAAVDAGIHVFAEKPMAVDMAGVKSIIKSAQIAKQKNIAIQHGYCWRFSPANRVSFQKAHDGELGRITGFYGTYLGSPVRALAPDAAKPGGMGDVEWQVREWINFEWLSGGPLLEQCIHIVDKIAWAMNDVDPIAAVGNGGRGQRTDAGNVYDNYSIVYEYPGGVYAHCLQRQYAGCHNENISRIICEGGSVVGPWKVSTQDKSGETDWKYREKRGEEQNMYQVCHNEFFAALRKGEIINKGEYMAKSTALGILGREAAHTGQRVTWEDVTGSNEDMAPDDLAFNDDFPVPPPPIPGKDEFAA